MVGVLLVALLSGCSSLPEAEWQEALQPTSHFYDDEDPYIVVSISKQQLLLMHKRKLLHSYAISTSRFGVGSESGSNKTPLGMHRIHSKAGDGVPLGGIFEGRKYIDRIAFIHKDATNLPEDLITTRVLRLEGLEQGLNKGRGVDSFQRYIYIHGTSEEGLLGRPSSHGCVRMKNTDVVDLYRRVSEGTLVYIQE